MPGLIGALLGAWERATGTILPPAPQAPPVRPLFRPVSTWGVFPPQPSFTADDFARRKTCRELDTAYLARAHDLRSMK